MNTALKRTSEHGGPVILGAGMTLLAIALVTSATHTGITAAPPPGHATTPPATAPPAATTVTKPARPRTTSNAPRTEPTTGDQVVAASEPRASSSSTRRPGRIAPSGPAPKLPAATQQPSTTRCDVGVTALIVNACVNLGGH